MAKRSIPSILTDAIIGKQLGWRIEFLTGGYQIFPFNKIVDIANYVSEIFGEKIWINLGSLTEDEMDKLSPYVEGICASIETIEPKLHKDVCPDKPIEPYAEMLKLALKKGFKTSATIVIGLGETKDDFTLLKKFIEDHKLDRITFYALKPIQGTPYTESPDPEYYAWWIRETRNNFPDLQIMAGLTPKRPDYAKYILKAGASAITKFPAIRKFNSDDAKLIEQQVKELGLEFTSSLTKLPDIDWDKLVDTYSFDDKLKGEVKEKLKNYINKMRQA